MESIYTRIEKMLQTEGRVPYNVVLEEKDPDDNGIPFAPGALEGILGHHSSGKGANAEKLAAFFKEHLQEEPDKVLEQYEKECKEFKMATCRNELLKEIVAHKEEYDANRLANLAYYMMQNGMRVETVKAGLVLMALFDMSQDEQVKKVLITLGCCEEFTDYMLVNISDWSAEEQNKVYFELAQKLVGWGKITAVEQLEADTEEIREWILCEGCKNEIMYSYLGLECARKCNYLERLRAGGLNEEELQGASDIMDGLLEEGPCCGISALEDAEETIYRYLCCREQGKIDVASYSQLLDIKEYLYKGDEEEEGSEADDESQEEYDVCWEVDEEDPDMYYEWLEWENARLKMKAKDKVEEILASVDLKKMLVEGLQKDAHTAVRIAEQMDIDIAPELFEWVKADFEKYYTQGYYFFTRKQFVEEYVALAEKHLDYDKLPKGMGSSLVWNIQGCWRVSMIVQYLEEYPGLGTELVRVCLQAPVIHWRNMAAKALEGWKLHTNQSLREFAPDLYQDVAEVAQQECDEKLRERWTALLEE